MLLAALVHPLHSCPLFRKALQLSLVAIVFLLGPPLVRIMTSSLPLMVYIDTPFKLPATCMIPFTRAMIEKLVFYSIICFIT
jgi:hypothetical protein